MDSAIYELQLVIWKHDAFCRLIGVGIIFILITILGGLSLTGSELDEKIKDKTVQTTESDSYKQEKNVSNSVKCSSDAFGRMVCSP